MVSVSHHIRNRNSEIVIVAILAMLFCGSNVFAEPSVEATVNRNTLSVGEQAALTLSVSDERGHDVATPVIPTVPNLDIRGPFGPSTSREFQFIQGRAAQKATTSYTFYIIPREPGEYQIPAIDVKVSGKTYQTQPISLTVGGSAPSESKRQQAPEIEVNVTVSADTVYQGEAVIVEYSLVESIGVSVSSRVITQEPEFTSAWVEKLFDAREDQSPSREHVENGVRRRVLPILRVALFPTKAGELRIPEMAFSATIAVPTGRRSFWGEALYDQRTAHVRSDARIIRVRSLPPGAPSGFQGAVGRYSVRSSIDQDTVTQGDPITWRVILEGEGNIKSAGEIRIPALNEFRAYDPQVTTEIKASEQTYGGVRSYERILVPLHSGRVSIPSASFVFFDPIAKQYRTAVSQRHDLTVRPRDMDGAHQALALTQSQIRQVGTDIRFIMPDQAVLTDESRTLWHSMSYWSVQVGAFVVFLVAIGARVRRERLGRDPERIRAIEARGEARRRMKRARSLLDQGNYPESIAAVRTALSELFAGHSNVRAGSITTQEVHDVLASKNVPDELVNRTVELLSTIDRVRYAPSTLSKEEAERVFSDGRDVLSDLVKHLSDR